MKMISNYEYCDTNNAINLAKVDLYCEEYDVQNRIGNVWKKYVYNPLG